jgi:hypothetical protein
MGAVPKDFAPTKETVSLHGLGFIQLVLPANRRLHVWHPKLPRRNCYADSAVHNHRFGFHSRVLIGTQVNVPVEIELVRNGSHEVISHNGPRCKFGGRESYPVAECNIYEGEPLFIPAGKDYSMRPGEYHHTPNTGVVVTLMTKTQETSIHANTIIRKGVQFHQAFDRFQMSTDELMDVVKDALLLATTHQESDHG